MNGSSRFSGFIASAGSILSAAASSACCWLPAVLIGTGMSAAGLTLFLGKYHLIFIGVAVIFLAAGFYLEYRRRPSCESDTSCAVGISKMARFNRITLWVSTAVVIAFAFFPTHIGALISGTGWAGTSAPACSVESAEGCAPAEGCASDAAAACGSGNAGGASAGAGCCAPASGTQKTTTEQAGFTQGGPFSRDDPTLPVMDRFNVDVTKHRIVVLLSPTCGGCVYAAEA